MNDLIIMAIVGLGSGILGLAGGWIVYSTLIKRSQSQAGARDPQPVANKTNAIADLHQETEERERNADRVINRLRELAENIAFDVEEHSETMSQANDRLQNEDSATKAVVEIVAEIVEANDSLNMRLNQAEKKLNEQAATIAAQVKESRTDSLTQVANRRAFDAEFAEARTKLNNNDEPVCVMMIDVDHFKNFNDQYGHVAGDEVLKQVAQSLRRATKHDAQVFRYGGEEFTVLFRDTNLEDIIAFAERIRHSIGSRGIDIDNQVLGVTASAGLAQLNSGESCEDAVKRADEALYDAKSRGRNCAGWNDCEVNHPIPAYDFNAVAVTGNANTLEMEGLRDDSAGGWRTQVSNRREFVQDACRRIAAQKRNGGLDSMLLLSVDQIQNVINDKGIETADILMRATAQFLRASVRDMDHVALYDDDQFAVWLPTAAISNATQIGERLRSAVARCKVPTNDGMLNFSVSVGICQLEVGDTHETMISRCEQAMRHAAEAGGNCCFASNSSLIERVGEDKSIPQD